MVYESLREILFDEKIKKFGTPGKTEKEKKCPEFRAYLYCQGHLSTEKRSVILPKNSTLQDAKDAFGRTMRQTKICDEEFHEINNPLEPIWERSTDCNISLIFQYKADEERKLGTRATEAMIRDSVRSTKNGLETLWRRVTVADTGCCNHKKDEETEEDKK